MKFSVNRVKAGLGEVQTSLHWAVSIPKPASVAGEFPEDLEVRIQTSGIPMAEMESLRVELGGHDIGFNGKTKKAGSLDWTAVEGTDARFTEYMYKWISSRWGGNGQDTTGKAATSEECKADVVIHLLNHADEVTQTFTLVGCLPSFSEAGSLSQDAEAHTPGITFEYDDFHFAGKNVKW